MYYFKDTVPTTSSPSGAVLVQIFKAKKTRVRGKHDFMHSNKRLVKLEWIVRDLNTTKTSETVRNVKKNTSTLS